MKNITIICSNSAHPIYSYLKDWKQQKSELYNIKLLNSLAEIDYAGDILFLVSCSEIVSKNVREMFTYNLVLHASDLPRGRGWSPHVWDIINGVDKLTLSLINAEDEVDTGDIWRQKTIHLTGKELYQEINHKLFLAEIELMSWACKHIDNVSAYPQSKSIGTYYRKRTKDDSRLDENASIYSQFNLLRVCDPERFPAFVVINGKKYKILVEEMNG
ncbi:MULTISPECIES: formyltransferase family protein [Shewanella]|uniref:formyltransferase family protein n=1 Tax=Shewanella TaxID=22 RepID=UPI001BC3DB58|nr:MULTISPECIES: formyltransferase family protein [Shewanella]GIU50579.1 hypothetical protein TUM4249_11700 [Shewanella sp. KT0246]